MIYFKRIHIEGFGSIISRTTIELDREGLTIIRGENGAGKTTAFSALSWCSTGKNLKEGSSIETWPKYKPASYRGTYVGLEFEKDGDEYEIIRCSSFTGNVFGAKGKDRLLLLKNGEEHTEKAKKDTQAAINKVFGISPDLFRASIIFGQNMKRFIEEDGPSKKKLLEEAFNILWITDAKDLADNYLKENQKKLSELNPKLAFLNSRLENTRDTLEDLDTQKQEWEEDKARKIKFAKEQLSGIKVGKLIIENWFLDADIRLKRLREEEKRLLSEEALILGYRKALIKAEKLQADKQTELDQLHMDQKQVAVGKKCKVCGSVLTSIDKIKEHYETEVEFVQTALNNAIKDVKRVKTEIASAQFSPDALNSLLQKISTLEADIKEARSQNEKIRIDATFKSGLENEIENLEKSEYPVDRAKLQATLEDTAKELAPLLKTRYLLEKNIRIYSWMGKTVFSNNGIKAFILDTMLDKLNQSLVKYSSSIGFQPEFSINMDSGRKDVELFIYLENEVVPYGDLSGGQKQLVNVAIAFAIHDLVSENNNFNLLVMDEVFENLSSASIEIVSEIIMEKAQTKSLYLITHHAEFNPINCRVLEAVLTDGVTSFS